MDVTPHELRDCQISDAFRGYSRDEVNELMERAAATIETQGEKIRILTERVSSVTTDAARTRNNDDIIQRTMVLAQRAADEAIGDASRQAAEMLSEAESRSRAMVDAANDEVHRVHDVERSRSTPRSATSRLVATRCTPMSKRWRDGSASTAAG